MVKVFNERGIVLVGARVWERIRPGVVYVDHGARHDPLVPGKVDRGGAINTIAPNGLTSKNCCGQATSGYLVDVTEVKNEEWEAWRRDHPGSLRPRIRSRRRPALRRLDRGKEGIDEGIRHRRRPVRGLLRLPVRLQGRACRQRLVAHRQAPARHRAVLDAGSIEHIRGTVPKVEMHYVPLLCQHCDEAPCIPSCPIEGAIYKREDGLVIIDSDKCTGCRMCVDACPYDVIYFNDDLNLAQKCTGCAHLLDGGEWKVPRCADACPTEAIMFGEESEFADLIAKAEVLMPETGAQAAGVLPEHPQEVRGRHRLRPGRQGDRRRRHPARSPERTAPPARRPPTASATSGSAAWPTTPRYTLTIAATGFDDQDHRRHRHRQGRQPGRHPAGAER